MLLVGFFSFLSLCNFACEPLQGLSLRVFLYVGIFQAMRLCGRLAYHTSLKFGIESPFFDLFLKFHLFQIIPSAHQLPDQDGQKTSLKQPFFLVFFFWVGSITFFCTWCMRLGIFIGMDLGMEGVARCGKLSSEFSNVFIIKPKIETPASHIAKSNLAPPVELSSSFPTFTSYNFCHFQFEFVLMIWYNIIQRCLLIILNQITFSGKNIILFQNQTKMKSTCTSRKTSLIQQQLTCITCSSQASIQTPHVCLCRIYGTVTVHQSLVESLLEHGWNNNRSFLGLSACQLQAVEQVFFAVNTASYFFMPTVVNLISMILQLPYITSKKKRCQIFMSSTTSFKLIRSPTLEANFYSSRRDKLVPQSMFFGLSVCNLKLYKSTPTLTWSRYHLIKFNNETPIIFEKKKKETILSKQEDQHRVVMKMHCRWLSLKIDSNIHLMVLSNRKPWKFLLLQMVALEKITIKVLPQNLFDLMSFVKLKHPSANQLYQKLSRSNVSQDIDKMRFCMDQISVLVNKTSISRYKRTQFPKWVSLQDSDNCQFVPFFGSFIIITCILFLLSFPMHYVTHLFNFNF
ncbi:putative signal peptide protein [Puccinia sorghi]|uniref:Putative signal peptide protein n=1 Tax=Puccinia sorghi TaxID=27349 RepID=A0A0L6UZI7_9BASI|nr:putative signal peptide protein [Puccinia sorghi]